MLYFNMLYSFNSCLLIDNLVKFLLLRNLFKESQYGFVIEKQKSGNKQE
jgi:hypothetical protein